MEQYLDLLQKSPLFASISDLPVLLNCLTASERHYEKNSFIFMAGDIVTTIGIVLSGSVHIVQEDFWGNRTILSNIERGGLFGEALSCLEEERLLVSVLAAQSSDVLLVDIHRVTTTCSAACVFHTRLIHNLLRILAQKNAMLTQKMSIMTQPTTREKLLAYLSSQARRAGSRAFTIPFNRQELADYLSVDRSAMSNALSKMQDEGVLTFHRSSFELLL